MRQTEVYADVGALFEAAAARIANALTKAVEARSRAAIALAGGSTPEALYERLAKTPWAEKIPWESVHVFWGDERCVAPDRTESNYRMAREALLEFVPVPSASVHRIPAEGDPAEAALTYEQTIRDVLGPEPVFDVVLLGMGDDGHTASLFPGTAAVDVTDRLTTGVFVPKLGVWRVSLTLRAINTAREVLFLVAGEGKADMVSEVLGLEAPSAELPASLVNPAHGDVIWMMDEAAASKRDRT